MAAATTFPPLMALAVYLKALRLVLDEGLEARHVLIAHLGALIEDARTARRDAIVATTGQVGRDQGNAFRALRERLKAMEPPELCAGCHHAVGHWLDETLAACAAMQQVGETNDLALLRDTQAHLASSREDARRFNEEYQRLVKELRKRVQAAERRRKSPVAKLKGLFGGKKATPKSEAALAAVKAAAKELG